MMSDDTEFEEGPGLGSFFSAVPTIIWERKWWIIVPLIIGILAALAAVILIRPVYQSSALMLVQSRQLPNEILGQTNTEVVDRRIARIRQQIISRPDLVSLIQRHGLYSDERESQPLADIVDQMRKSITLTPASVGAEGSQPDQRTIAFKLAFDYEEAARAQNVTQDLMDKVLELDASGNVEQATNTAQFLEDQAKNLEEQINSIEDEIRKVNTQYGGVLSNGGVTVLGSGGGSYDVQIAALQRDNANLINQKQVAQSSDNRDPVVVQAESALAAARAVYAESHPDVVIARQRLAEARELAKSNARKLPLETIDQQIAFNNSQISALRAAKAMEQSQMNAQLSAQSRAPLVKQQIDALQQRLQGVNQQYQTVQTRLLAARAGVRAEDEQLSERLSVIEPPIVPEEPIWPDRLMILALGLGGGLAVGVILAFSIELLMRPIRDADSLAAIMGAQPLGLVPVIEPGNQSVQGIRRFIPRRLRWT